MSITRDQVIEAVERQLESKHDALPTGFKKVRFLENCKAYLQEGSGYEKYSTAEPVAEVLFQGAILGLDFLAKECHLLTREVLPKFQTDYKGEKKLAKKHSVRPVLDIYAKNVREGDDFREEIIDGKATVSFLPLPFNDSSIIGTFAVALFEDGGMIYEALSTKEIEEIQKHYGNKGQNNDTLEKSRGEMFKRTALRRLCKHIELDLDTNQMIAFESAGGFTFNQMPQAPKPAQNSPFNPPEESEVIQNDRVAETDQG